MLALLLAAALLDGQATSYGIVRGVTLPATCAVGDTYILTTGETGLYTCTAEDTWTKGGAGPTGPQGPQGPMGPTGPQGPAGDGGVPSGLIALALGACPTGWTEVTALNGVTVIGTLAANNNVGTTGGADSVTPTFTGVAFTDVITHTHAVTVTDPGHSHLTQRYPTATGGSSGFTIDTSMSGTLADNTLPVKSAATGITAATEAPVGAVTSITPAGSISAVDNRSAFVRVIFCQRSAP